MDHRLVMLLLFLAYFAPSIVANVRHVRNVGSVVVVNLFLGWTFIGWVVALAMAGGGTEPRQFRAPGGYVVDRDQHHYLPTSPPPLPMPYPVPPPPPPLAPAGWYPDPSGKGERYWTGRQWSDSSPRPDLVVERTYNDAGAMLSSLVVLKATGDPGDPGDPREGFYRLAKRPGLLEPSMNRSRFFQQQVGLIHRHYACPRPQRSH